MSFGGLDESIVQDFLTESGELLERLDQDLVSLEQSPADPEMINQVFRALHTIKGSASFLNLTNLVAVAHCAESALNAARNKVVVVDREMMDLLLAAVDTLKTQFEQLRAGKDLVKGNERLIARLTQIGEGKQNPPGETKNASETGRVAPTQENIEQASNVHTGGRDARPTQGNASARKPLELPENKKDLVDFLVTDLREAVGLVEAAASEAIEPGRRSASGSRLAEQGETLARHAEFFEIESMSVLAALLRSAGEALAGGAVSEEQAAQVLPRVSAAAMLLREQTEAIDAGEVVLREVAALRDMVDAALRDGGVPEGHALGAGAGGVDALRADGLEVVGATPTEKELDEDDVSGISSTLAPNTPESNAPGTQSEAPPASQGEAPAKAANAASDQTIRVEVSRLEALLNLVGELVLQKNRISAISRQVMNEAELSQGLSEAVTQATSSLDRVTSDLQVAVMKTRMQPLEKLFGRYPRLIRDLARKTNKQIRLEIEGGDTEVDKSVIEELGDPLVHILRNSCDHGVETPEQRRAAGKPECGTIKLIASHEGSHVLVQIKDDGKGLSRERIGNKAVEKGLVTPESLALMSDREVYQFIFAAGFSTAEQVSDLSGRGVGMDVVRTNIEHLKGTVTLESTPGQGTTISVTIPLTVAILTAMMVGIGPEQYAVPLGNIVEIVKPEKASLSTIQQKPVMRLRDTVLPLLNGCEVFNLPHDRRQETPFAVVVTLNEKRVGLMVSRLIGQQEVVIKPLDESATGGKGGGGGGGGPVSGATVRDDGGVSLIVDVARMIRLAEDRR